MAEIEATVDIMAGRAVDTHLAAADRTDRVAVEADIEVAEAAAAAMAAVGVMVAAVTEAVDTTGRSIAVQFPSPNPALVPTVPPL